MASTTPTASSLSRYRPIVLTLTGAAAAYAAYLLYSSTRSDPTSSLHRSNAVHRRRNPRRSAQSQGHDDVDAQARVEDQEGAQPGRPYGIFVVRDANNHTLRHRISLFPGRLPDVEWFRRVCHHDTWMADELVIEAQRQFLNNYLEQEVDSTTQLATSAANDEVTGGVYRRLIGWGLPQDQIFAAFTRHNARVSRLQQTDGAQGSTTIPAANDDETDAASGHETESQPGGIAINDAQNSDGHALRRTLYYIAEDQARQKGIIHRGITCDGCSTTPIRGIRWRCTNCVDYDLCSDCEATNIHPKTHMFQKVKVPARYLGYTRNPMPVYFPGNPNYMPSIVPNAARKLLEGETGYEPEEIDGLWEQFTCLANVQWEDDPETLGAAIDRRAFDKSFVPRYTANIPAPNLVYDRVFTFFDSNGDGLIGFREFVVGMHYIRMNTRCRNKLRKIFECYDIDGDGYVTRKDFLRIFRAYYNILKEKTRDMLLVAEEHLTVAGAMDTVESSQPLSSAFLGGPNFNRARNNTASRKTLDRFGDPQQDQEVVRENGRDFEERSQLIADAGELQLNNRRASPHDEPVPSADEARQEAVGERWRRREFYIDVEEGLAAPENSDVDPGLVGDQVPATVGGQADTPNGIYTRPSHSRSSSRVRFADDLESDARSDVSTSSRPIGERWGGYEIPQAEEDLGKDILYQVTQQGCNEMLDPLFKRREDLAMEVQATKAERQNWRQKINEFAKDMEEKTGADFKNDPLIRSPEAEELMKISFQFVALVTGRSWRTYQTIKSKGFIPNEDIDALDGFVEEVFQPFERDLKQAETSGMSNAASKRLIASARSLISKAAKRISETKHESPSATDASKREARLEVDLVDMQLDELFERSNLMTEHEHDATERTRRSNAPEREVNGGTRRTADQEFDYESSRRWATELLRGTTSLERPAPSSTQRPTEPSTPVDPTMPQFRPDSDAEIANREQDGNDFFFLPIPNHVLPSNTTALPQQPTPPGIPSSIAPPSPVASALHRDPTMPQFRPNSERDLLPHRTSSLNQPLAANHSDTPSPHIRTSLALAPTQGNEPLRLSFALAPTHANEPVRLIPVSSETSASQGSSDVSSGASTSADNEDADADGDDDEDDDEDDEDDEDHAIHIPAVSLPDELLSLFSTAVREQRVRDAITSSSAAAQLPNAHLTAAYARQKDHDEQPDEKRLARLAMLEGAETEIKRVGRGRLGFDEFAELMEGAANGALVFVEGWLELGSL